MKITLWVQCNHSSPCKSEKGGQESQSLRVRVGVGKMEPEVGAVMQWWAMECWQLPELEKGKHVLVESPQKEYNTAEILFLGLWPPEL